MSKFALKPLGELAEFLDSQRRPVKSTDRKPGPYPYYGANGQQGTIDGYIFDEPLVLLAEDGGHFFDASRGIAYRITGKTWVNNHAHVLRPRPGTDINYLCLVLRHMDVTQHLTGTTRAKLTKAGASRIQIPLPPLAEQKRIAAILDAADALRAKRRESLAQLDSLLKSTFLDMFGDPVTNPKGWETTTIGNHIKVIGGFAFKSSDFAEEGLPIVRISNLSGDSVNLEGCARIPISKLGKGVKFRLQPGDTLIAMSGATTGKLGFVPGGLEEEWYLNQRVGAFRVPRNSEVDRAYLRALLRSSFYQDHVWNLAGGAAQPNISGKQLESAEIPLPPLDLQQRFATIVESVEQQKSRLRAHLAELDTLFASLQSRAFRGEL